MIKIEGIKLGLSENEKDLFEKVKKITKGKAESFYVFKKAIDARRKDNVHFVYSVVAKAKGEEALLKSVNGIKLFDEKNFEYPILKRKMESRPVIIGSGPAGSFAALCLAKAGACPIVIERGKPVDERTCDTESFFAGGTLDTESNVQFGEGGAGTFSDGKLNTGTHSPFIRKILSEYVRFGANENILTDAKPHIGTDILKKIAVNIRREVESFGGTYFFSKKVSDIEIKNGKITAVFIPERIETDTVILAIGHSARDTFFMLDSRGVKMEQKAFSVGLRIEHPQELINRAQYGSFYNHPSLGAADYKFGDDCYTFCMCPGGYVVAAASEEGGIVTNGMSYSDRAGENANSALLVNVNEKDFGTKLFAGVEFQRKIERAAYEISKSYMAPCQKLSDFFADTETKSFGSVNPTYKPGVVPSDIRKILPGRICDNLKSGILNIDKKLKGFATGDALLTAPETRSSSPVRILRDETLQAIGIEGLYPSGEGAGYAGGIMSAAADGIRCAVKVIEKMNE
ncbi:MAG: hypothetical protein Q4G23_09445 [Clostridia bacterium]|nr:hypothetical protein [Clostridia bacterium]